MSNPFKEIERFAVDRQIHNMEYDGLGWHTNVLEEMIESIGGDVKKADRDTLRDEWGKTLQRLMNAGVIGKELVVTNNDTRIDALADCIVFCSTEMMKLQYDPSKVLEEVAKEINSRTGEITNGKFEKDLSDEAKAKWYKANFDNCRRNYDEPSEPEYVPRDSKYYETT